MLKLFLFFLSVCVLVSDLYALERSLILKDMRTEGRTALVIGNSKYDMAPLKNPVNDAREMKKLLEAKGFDVIYGEDATRNDMYDLFDEYIEKVDKNRGVALFYYAGHGVGVRGENFLIPVGARIKRPRDIQRNAFSINNILDGLADQQTRLNILILDACRNNPFQGSRSAAGGLATVNSNAKGTFIAYATAPGRTANDGDGKHSVYTKHLLNNMSKEGLTIEQVFKRVRASVEEDTNGVQTPWETSSLKGDFFFTLPSVKIAPPVVAAPAVIVAPTALVGVPLVPILNKNTATQSGNNDMYFWEEIKNSNTIVKYEAYLSQFPKGQYRVLAQLKIDELKAKSITFKLYVKTEPQDVKITFVGKDIEFEDGMSLPSGKYKLYFEKSGFKSYEHSFTLKDNIKLTIPLIRILDNFIYKKVYATYIEPDLKLIGSGKYVIGDKTSKGDKDEQVNKEIVFKNRFYIAIYEVTLAEYDKYTDAYNLKRVNPRISNIKNRNILPVTNISWSDANKYSEWLSKVSSKNYRLPTEAEWEYVARAGSNSLFFWGNNTKQAGIYSVYHGNAGHIYRVGMKKPNNWGFYDVSGNVWEWCQDSYSASYENIPLDGTAFIDSTHNKKVIRGGAWNSKEWTLRTSNRLWIKANKRRSTIGFRLAMQP